MKYILITGGCGYIGLHLSKLLSKNYNLLIYDNLKIGYSYLNNYGKIYKGDLSETNKLEYIFKNYEIISIIHLAGLAHISESFQDPQLYYYNNLCLSIKLLDLLVKYKINNFIFSSTCAVYGEQEQEVYETNNINPINPYGNSKACFEKVIIDYSKKYNFNYSILRYFNACGNDPDFEVGEYHKFEKRIIPRLINFSLENLNEMNIYGNDFNTKDGTAVRDYTHVMDIAEAHKKALEYMIKNNKSIICNIGSGIGTSIKELITIIEKVSNKKLNIKYTKKNLGDPAYLVCNNNKALELLNWNTKYNINDIIETSFEWYKNYLPKILPNIEKQKYYAIRESFDDNIYTGEIKDNKYNGNGKLILGNGMIDEGIFKDGVLKNGYLILECGEKIKI